MLKSGFNFHLRLPSLLWFLFFVYGDFSLGWSCASPSNQNMSFQHKLDCSIVDFPNFTSSLYSLFLFNLWISSGVVFRPAVIYGKRKVNNVEVPLDLVFEPVEKILNTLGNFTKPLNSLPASDLLLAPPVSVDDLALAVINAVKDDDVFGIFTIEQIKEIAAKVKV